jgi:hypothetical protein
MMSDWGAAVKPRDDEEDRLQIAIIGHLEWRLMPGVLWWHTPNGGKRSPATAARMKRLGVKPGVADLMFLLPGGTAAALELKAKGGAQSKAQKDWQAACEALGVPYVVTSNLDTALLVLESWGVIKPERL